MTKYNLTLPKMGESVDEATIVNWLKNIASYVNEVEQENSKAGIITVTHPFMGSYVHIDQETYRKYINDKQ